ncbi:HesA/MoeB/ThiF family protein [Niallia sp. NCCP-28]|uniref:HesA/MoeB/ThiF family protein n=1 Tax=Niallia sp. NCCP-28 TaxID=2934712 RepID=UPI002085A64E|nr:HesA/MoeB/ThiF family protein [Niallia sp. NCCP-28]GKU84572.1 adenylyltransferase [Niallia sp. NCCP-28]
MSPSIIENKNMDEYDRYSRQLKLLGTEGQQKLKNAAVFIAGIGGLGGTAALYLAAAGIGKLLIAHEGHIVLPDLNRQILMDSKKIGEERIPCAVESLKKINPEVEIEAYSQRINYETSYPLVSAADVVIDARYDFPERYALNKLCVDIGKPMIEAAMSGFEILLTAIKPNETACLACIFPERDKKWEPLGFPVLGATSGIAGCMAALEAIKILTGIGEPYYNKLYHFDSLNFQSAAFSLKRNPSCKHCADKGEVAHA